MQSAAKSMETQEHMLLEKVTIFSAEEGKKLKKRLEEELQSLQEQGEKLEKSASQKQKEYDTLLGNQAENGKRWMEYCEFVKNSYAEYQQERKKQGFADKESYEQALQQRDQLEQWKKEIDQYRIETVQCDTRCHTLREQIQGRKKEDTQLLAKQKEEAKRAYEEKKSEQEVITYHLETVKRVKKRVTELLKGRVRGRKSDTFFAKCSEWKNAVSNICASPVFSKDHTGSEYSIKKDDNESISAKM